MAPELIRYLKFEILGTINNFEDLEIWKDARHFCKMIYQNCLQNDKFQKYDKLQIDRASSSIMDNITEGFERKGNREFINFLIISKRSCGEVRSQESEPMTANTLMKKHS